MDEYTGVSKMYIACVFSTGGDFKHRFRFFLSQSLFKFNIQSSAPLREKGFEFCFTSSRRREVCVTGYSVGPLGGRFGHTASKSEVAAQ